MIKMLIIRKSYKRSFSLTDKWPNLQRNLNAQLNFLQIIVRNILLFRSVLPLSSVPDHLYKFNCTSCNVNVSCAHGGIDDVKGHISTNKHKTAHSNRQRKFTSTYYTYSLLSYTCCKSYSHFLHSKLFALLNVKILLHAIHCNV